MQLTYLHIHNFKSIRDMEITDIDSALILVGKTTQERPPFWMPSALSAAIILSRNLILMKSFRPSALKHRFPLTKKI